MKALGIFKKNQIMYEPSNTEYNNALYNYIVLKEHWLVMGTRLRNWEIETEFTALQSDIEGLLSGTINYDQHIK